MFPHFLLNISAMNKAEKAMRHTERYNSSALFLRESMEAEDEAIGTDILE
jgi:hypothetical protein